MTENEAIEVIKRLIGISPSERIVGAVNMAISALEEIQKYRAIGTVEEFREAREGETPKKPIMKPFYEDMEEEYLCCPACGDILTDRIPVDNKDFYFHCLNCGQKLDWRE